MMYFDSKANKHTVLPSINPWWTNGDCFLDIDCYCWSSLVWVFKMDFLTEIFSFLKADVFNFVKWFPTMIKFFLIYRWTWHIPCHSKMILIIALKTFYHVRIHSAGLTPPFFHPGLRIYPTIGFYWNDPTGKLIDCLSEVSLKSWGSHTLTVHQEMRPSDDVACV